LNGFLLKKLMILYRTKRFTFGKYLLTYSYFFHYEKNGGQSSEKSPEGKRN
jgi:hypothetical protein